MKKNIVIMVCAISMFMGFNACKSKQYAEVAEAVSVVNPLLVGKHWKLVELNGKPVEKQDAFLLLDKDKNTVSGNLGCNTFSGSYELRNGNRIQFSQVISTLKMCMNNMEIEDGLKKVLEMADNYAVNENTLILNRLRMAPLAKFELEK
jgi:heat shock protein HslJ